MRSLWAAVHLLTGVPGPRPTRATPDQLVGSLLWFPVVGAGLGALLGFIEWGVRRVSGSSPLACGLAVTLGLAATGGRPLQGLMVVSGALFAGRDPEGLVQLAGRSVPTRFGVLVGLAAQLLKYALLLALPGQQRLGALVLALGLARGGIVWALWRFPYAGIDMGIGEWFAAVAGVRDLPLVLPVVALGVGLLDPVSVLAAWAGTWLLVHGFSLWVSRMLSGLSAQACEAVAEVGELGGLAAVAGLGQALQAL